jgi:hypothetical protein
VLLLLLLHLLLLLLQRRLPRWRRRRITYPTQAVPHARSATGGGILATRAQPRRRRARLNVPRCQPPQLASQPQRA